MLEEESQRAAKQQKTVQARQRGSERRESQASEPQAWLPTPMLNGEPLRDNASIRDFHGGDGCHVASALEAALLLPNDMAELRSIKRHEVFLNLKRYLGMVCTLFFFYISMIICKVTNPPSFRLSKLLSGLRRSPISATANWMMKGISAWSL